MARAVAAQRRPDREVARGTVRGASDFEPWEERVFELDALAGERGSFVVVAGSARAEAGRAAASLFVFELVAAQAADLDVERSRSFRALRIRNESELRRVLPARGLPGTARPPSPAPTPAAAGTQQRIESAME